MMPTHSAQQGPGGGVVGAVAPVAKHASASAPVPAASPVPSLAELYEAEFDYAFRCLRGLGVAPAAVDDAVQDVFLVVQRRLPEFDGHCRVRTWLYAIVLRVARKYRGRQARDAARFVGDTDRAGEGTCGERQVLQDERLAIAHAALQRLDPAKREVFVLAQVEQLSGPEVAQVMGLPLGTVYSRLRAARTAFDAHVARLSRLSSADTPRPPQAGPGRAT